MDLDGIGAHGFSCLLSGMLSRKRPIADRQSIRTERQQHICPRDGTAHCYMMPLCCVLGDFEDDVQAKPPISTHRRLKILSARQGAISIGISRDAYKFSLKEGEDVPPLLFDILEDVEKQIHGFPIVLHGG